jgi:hypothetical protein
MCALWPLRSVTQTKTSPRPTLGSLLFMTASRCPCSVCVRFSWTTNKLAVLFCQVLWVACSCLPLLCGFNFALFVCVWTYFFFFGGEDCGINSRTAWRLW